MLRQTFAHYIDKAISFIAVFSLLFAAIVGVWLLFPGSNPETATKWFLAPYHKAYLPLLAVGCSGYFYLAIRRQYKFANEASAFLISASALGTAATVRYLEAYYWAPIVLVCAIVYKIWLLVAVPRDARGVTEKARIGDQSINETPVESIRFPAVKAKVNFTNVVGMKDVKMRLLDAGDEVVSRMKKREEARNGILLYGDPGNGKTFFAEALAGELQLPIIKASFGDVVSKWIGETSESVRQIFLEAAKQAPCVLFIDEIDSLIRDRNASMSGGNSEEAKTTNILLTSLVNIREQGVVVIAATNYLDRLDGAAIREGRFDFKVEITSPDAEARSSLIKKAVSGYREIQLSAGAVAQATKRWDGFSVARIRAVVDEACRTAKNTRMTWIEYPDLQAALRITQGNQGDAIPADTPLLDAVIMPSDQLSKLTGIAHRMLNIEEIEELGGSVPTGILFYGPPGTGKTMTVRSLAKKTGWALKGISGGDLMADMKKVDEIEAFAKNNRPCIIFIDEADDVLGHRGMSGGAATALTNKLLAAIDGAKGKTPDVVWVAATNHPDSLDEAAMRGGRFTEKIEFSAPDSSTAAKLAGKWIAKTKATFAIDVTGEAVAELLDGETPANINAILQQAVNQMIERKARIGVATKVTLDDIAEARLVVTGD